MILISDFLNKNLVTLIMIKISDLNKVDLNRPTLVFTIGNLYMPFHITINSICIILKTDHLLIFQVHNDQYAFLYVIIYHYVSLISSDMCHFKDDKIEGKTVF